MVADMALLPIPRRRVALAAVVLGACLPAAPAHAFRLGHALEPVAANPAEALAAIAPEAEDYDPATRCDRKRKPGVTRLVRWLRLNATGEFWGSYRCERWGPHEASLHAEGRAVDWHLDAGTAVGRRDARALIELLLAPDAAGTPHALARRMGVQELIWDCSYWSAGQEEFGRLSVCFSKHGRPRHGVSRTAAHRDHIHIGVSRRGAWALTSFWAS
ncbi:MAG: hypothetical protein JWN65_1076 [Solirubrobacterales bacterium]|nr:hypothetical protein [Solirubrobacterales bacterium]